MAPCWFKTEKRQPGSPTSCNSHWVQAHAWDDPGGNDTKIYPKLNEKPLSLHLSIISFLVVSPTHHETFYQNGPWNHFWEWWLTDIYFPRKDFSTPNTCFISSSLSCFLHTILFGSSKHSSQNPKMKSLNSYHIQKGYMSVECSSILWMQVKKTLIWVSMPKPRCSHISETPETLHTSFHWMAKSQQIQHLLRSRSEWSGSPSFSSITSFYCTHILFKIS